MVNNAVTNYLVLLRDKYQVFSVITAGVVNNQYHRQIGMINASVKSTMFNYSNVIMYKVKQSHLVAAGEL